MMPLSAPAQPFERTRQQEGQHAVLGQLDTIQTCAHQAHRARGARQQAHESLQELERVHSDFARAHFRSIAAFILLLATLGAVYWVDFLLFSSTAEYFAARVFHSMSWIVPLACVLSPALLLMIEVGVSLQRDLARESASFGSRGLVMAWTVTGVLLAAVIPLLAVATLLAARPATSDTNLAAALETQTVALAILAFAGHLLVLFGGRSAHDAKAFVAFKTRQLSLQQKARGEGGRFEQNAQRMTQAFNVYYHRLRAYNGHYGDEPMEVGPFDAITRGLINERFGNEVIVLGERSRSSRNGSRGRASDHSGSQRMDVPSDELGSQDLGNGNRPAAGRRWHRRGRGRRARKN